MKSSHWIGILLVAWSGAGWAQSFDGTHPSHTYTEILDPSSFPISDSWISNLDPQIPVLGTAPIRHEFLELWERQGVYPAPVVDFVPRVRAASREFPILYGPTEVRIRPPVGDEPVLSLEVEPFTGVTTVEVEVESVVSAQARESLQRLEALGAPLSPLSSRFVSVQFLDSNARLPLLERLETQEQVSGLMSQPTSLRHWTGRVRFRLTPLGKDVLWAVLKSGARFFPFVLEAQFRVVSLVDVSGARDLSEWEDPVVHRDLSLRIPGALSCLRRGLWGKIYARRDGRCAQAWE